MGGAFRWDCESIMNLISAHKKPAQQERSILMWLSPRFHKNLDSVQHTYGDYIMQILDICSTVCHAPSCDGNTFTYVLLGRIEPSPS